MGQNPKIDMNPRTCVVTGEQKTPSDMIRFVLDPQECIVPDLKQKLPGRGVWISNSRSKLELAINKGCFDRGFKKPVKADRTLPELVRQLLEKDCLEFLALTRKAGQAISGFAKVENAIRSGNVAAVLHASEAAADGKGKIAQAIRVCGEGKVMTIESFEGEKLDAVTGVANTTHIALLRGGLADRFVEAAKRLERFKNN